jgi:hypothetical protein
MSSAYREPPPEGDSQGERLWRQSTRSSTLAITFVVATALGGIWLFASDPKNGGPPVAILGGFAAFVLFAWVFISRSAIVAMFEKGLRVGWVGGRTHFVPWDQVTRVEHEVRSRTDQNGFTFVTEYVRVHCRGHVYSLSDRLVGKKSFLAARTALHAHVPRTKCFEAGPR